MEKLAEGNKKLKTIITFAGEREMIMIGQKFIPQTIKGEKAVKITKFLSKRQGDTCAKGRAPLPDKFSTTWK